MGKHGDRVRYYAEAISGGASPEELDHYAAAAERAVSAADGEMALLLDENQRLREELTLLSDLSGSGAVGSGSTTGRS